ncbi:MAG: hypothetical protein HKN25_09905 [Pyrinomonadaceae bacterium]|nr:hypothetical protein [Pyrinomonadaceae bacterium]
MEFWIDVLGWIGALLILLAYALISLKKVEGSSLSYQMMNIFASIFLTMNTAYYGAIPSTLVNMIWAVIAAVAIFAIFRNWKRNAAETRTE